MIRNSIKNRISSQQQQQQKQQHPSQSSLLNIKSTPKYNIVNNYKFNTSISQSSSSVFSSYWNSFINRITVPFLSQNQPKHDSIRSLDIKINKVFEYIPKNNNERNNIRFYSTTTTTTTTTDSSSLFSANNNNDSQIVRWSIHIPSQFDIRNEIERQKIERSQSSPFFTQIHLESDSMIRNRNETTSTINKQNESSKSPIDHPNYNPLLCEQDSHRQQHHQHQQQKHHQYYQYQQRRRFHSDHSHRQQRGHQIYDEEKESSGESAKDPETRRLHRRGMIASFITLGVLVWLTWYWLNRHPNKVDKNHEKALATKNVVNRDSIGRRDFNLVDQQGRVAQRSSFEGQWVYMMFGSTQSNPRIQDYDKPERFGLNKFNRTIQYIEKMLDEDEENYITPVFVTLDPEHDTPQVLQQHLSQFRASILGLTGDRAEIERMIDDYTLIHRNPETGKEERLPPACVTYLLDPQGRFVCYFDPSEAQEDIGDIVMREINLYNRKQKLVPNP